MKIVALALWGLLSWAAVQVLVFLPIFLAGLLLLPGLFRWAPIVQVESRLNAGQLVEAFAWGWAQELWGNWEDGLSPRWWCDVCHEATPTWKTRMTWFLRNPVSNMRYWPIISTRPDPARVRFIGTPTIPPDGMPCLFLAWQGGFVGFRWQGASWGIWMGWAVNPSDRLGMPKDWRSYGYSVVLQILHGGF